MIGNAKQGKPFFSGSHCHVGNGAGTAMTAGNGMGMYIKLNHVITLSERAVPDILCRFNVIKNQNSMGTTLYKTVCYKYADLSIKTTQNHKKSFAKPQNTIKTGDDFVDFTLWQRYNTSMLWQ